MRAVRGVRGACFSPIAPVPVSAPRLVAASPEVARSLALSEAACASDAFLQVFAGNALLAGMEPYAACYGGHQFGSWAGQLGDGRAISLAEVVNAAGRRWELQLKGAGATPYSRSADGRAVLRSSIREFLCSEAMAHLGVPTTRALSLVATGEEVVRDMFYDGHPRAEPGAIVCRVAPSFLRFGNFELFAARGEVDASEAAGRLHPPASLSRARRAVARDLRRLADGDLPSHGTAHGALDAGRLRSRRDEHRQHVDPGADHRLRAVRFPRQLRPRLHPQHHRRRRAPLSLFQSAARRQVEPDQAGGGAPPADRQHPAPRRGAGRLYGDVRSRREPPLRRQAGAGPGPTSLSSTSCSRCWRWWRPT